MKSLEVQNNIFPKECTLHLYFFLQSQTKEVRDITMHEHMYFNDILFSNLNLVLQTKYKLNNTKILFI